MPSGRVRFFDVDKEFGFIAGENGAQVYVHASAVAGEDELQPGMRVEYSVAEGRKGPQALSVKILDRPQTNRRKRKSADEMAVIVEDLVKLLDGVGSRFKAGHYPERAQSRKVATMLRHLADEFDA